MKKYLYLALLLAILLGFGIAGRLSALRSAAPAPNISDLQARQGVPVVVVNPVRKPLRVDIDLLGTVAPLKEIAVSARVAEEITGSHLALGKRVSRDETLVELYDEMIGARLQQAEAAVAQTQAMLDKLHAGARPQEVRQAEARLEAARAAAESAEKEFQRMGSLRQSNAIPEQKAEKIVAANEAAKAELQSARQQLSLVKEGARREDIRTAEAAHRQALASLELARIQMRQTRIKAPVDGVVSKISKEVGEQTEVGKPVFSLMQIDSLFLLVDVPRHAISQVRVGLPARIIREDPPLEVTGEVAEIKPDADPLSRTFLAKIRFPNADGACKPGMFVRAFIELAAKPEALVLPKDCLTAVATQTGVYVVGERHRVTFLPVTTGLRGRDEIEIIGDLPVNSRVVLQGQKNLVPEALVDIPDQS